MELLEKKLRDLENQLSDVLAKRNRLDVTIYGIEKSITKIKNKLADSEVKTEPSESSNPQ